MTQACLVKWTDFTKSLKQYGACLDADSRSAIFPASTQVVSSGKAADLYSEDAWIESRHAHWLSWVRFSWFSSVTWGYCRNSSSKQATTATYHMIWIASSVMNWTTSLQVAAHVSKGNTLHVNEWRGEDKLDMRVFPVTNSVKLCPWGDSIMGP
jgi:hypothetical protein